MMSCSNERQIITNAGFLAVVASQATAGFLSAIFSIIVLRKCGNLHVHQNCKILIVSMVMLYIVHSVSITILQTTQLIRYLTYYDPCVVGLSTVICFCLRLPASVCTTSFASLLFAIVFERATALWKRGKYDAYGPQLGYALVTISIIVSLASTFWAVQKVEFDQHSVYCSTATSQTADRVMLLCFLISGVNIITLVGIIALFIFNEFALSRREFDLQSSYQLRENAYVIRIMLPLSIFQAICYAIFSISSGLISLFRDKLSPVQHKTLYTTAY
ncbi:hypothetical protein NECAME_11725, partial [Necator americanus]